MMPRNALKLAGLIAGCQAAGLVGTVFQKDSLKTWYPRLEKPPFNPPGWIFAPVWTTLYAMMGVAMYSVTEADAPDRGIVRLSKVLFGVQLALNVAWTYIFFGRRSLLFGLVEIVALWLAILATILAFAKVSRRAALLMLPYLAWVTFATLLTEELWRRNA